jgi:hypothetical protein
VTTKTLPVKAVEVTRMRAGERVPAGAYWFMAMPSGDRQGEVMGIEHGCPCGCGQKSVLFFRSYTKEDGWDVDKPFPDATLSPSIGMFRGQTPYHWHGFLERGWFVNERNEAPA